MNNRRWAAVADSHLPSIASSLKRIAEALEAIKGHEAESKEEQCIGETFSKAESLGWENPLPARPTTELIDAAEEEALAFLAKVKGRGK